ncbi:MAG: hypothetical protein NVS3B10_16830 [Polyangiales bacterium]
MRRRAWSALAIAPFALASCVDVSPAPAEFHPGSHVDDWRDEVIYQVLVDRFADGDASNDHRVDRSAPARFHGGDWRGLAEHLDYVQALGVSAIWISPIVKNVETDAGIDSYHGYWQQDPFALNPHFGNLQDLRDFVGKAHARGIKVILDVVTNHMGQLFYYDINMNGRPDEDVRGGVDPTGTATSPTIHISEYDPDYEAPAVMSWTSLGVAGPAPVNLHVNFLDNHDVGRFLWQARGRADATAVLRNALVFQLTEDGIPCIYYGTEQGFSGGNDPANREDLWNSGYATNGELFGHVARLTQLRRKSKALSRGKLSFAWTSSLNASPGAADADKAACASGTDCGLVAFERTIDGTNDYALVVINTHPTQKAATNGAGAVMKVSVAPGTTLVDALATTGGRAYPVGADGKLNVELGPNASVVLLPQGSF